VFKIKCTFVGCELKGEIYGYYAGIPLVYCDKHKEIFFRFKKYYDEAQGAVDKEHARHKKKLACVKRFKNKKFERLSCQI